MLAKAASLETSSGLWMCREDHAGLCCCRDAFFTSSQRRVRGRGCPRRFPAIRFFRRHIGNGPSTNRLSYGLDSAHRVFTLTADASCHVCNLTGQDVPEKAIDASPPRFLAVN